MKKDIRRSYGYLSIALIASFIVIILDVYISINIGDMANAAISKDKNLFLDAAKIGLICSLALLLVNIISDYLYNLYKLKATSTLKCNYINKIFNKNINEYQKENIAKYVSGFTNDISTIEKEYIENIYNIIKNILRLIVTFILIVSISVRLLIFMVLLGVGSTLISILASQFMKKYYKKRSGLYEELSVYIKEILNTFHIIKLNDISEKIKGSYFNKVERVENENYKIDKLDTISGGLQELFSKLLFIGTYVIILYCTKEGMITLGSVFVVGKNIQYIINPIIDMTTKLPSFMATKPVFKLLEEISISNSKSDEKIKINALEEEIRIEDVSFSYEEEKVLENLNLTFKKGHKYLVVGQSGCGKSTMLKIMRKYYSPQSGGVYVDNINLNDITSDSYYKCISNIEQQVFLFEDTLKNNITLYKNYTEEEIENAINLSGLRSFVEQLPNSLETMILDNGKNISGGEKSRIAIARSLLMKFDLLLIDEAFANLDYETAKNIEKTILSIPNITVINVSHVIFESNEALYDEVYALGSC